MTNVEWAQAPSWASKIVTTVQSHASVKVVSLDVFDTVLTSSLLSPHSVFFEVGTRLWQQGKLPVTPEVFARARALAARRLRDVVSPEAELTIDQIYDELERSAPWACGLTDLFQAEEQATESACIHAVPDMLELTRTLSDRGYQIIFVSDMYLPGAFVRQALKKYGFLDREERVYVSADYLHRKAGAGLLFKTVLKDLGATGGECFHIGNNPLADYQSAKNVGMHALHVNAANPTRYEKLLAENGIDTCSISDLYAGASRMARLRIHDTDASNNSILPVCTGVAAPLIFSYACWLLRRAEQLGIRRLYFLAREAEAVFDAARMIVATTGSDIELNYLYVSRRALNLALLSRPDADELQWALTGHDKDTVRSLLHRLGLKPEDLTAELEAMALHEQDFDRPITQEDLPDFLRQIESGTLRQPVIEAALGRRRLVEAYLAQCDFFAPGDVGLVDTTGLGSQFRALDRLRRANGGTPTQGFLMARIWRPELNYDQFPVTTGYFYDQYTYRKAYAVDGLSTLLEVFCAGTHGTVAGYQDVNGVIEPILSEYPNHGTRLAYTQTVRAAVETFTEIAMQHPEIINRPMDVRQAVLAAFAKLWHHPTAEDVVAWADYPLEQGNRGSVLAPGLGLLDLWRLKFRDPSGRFMGSHAWRSGSELASARHIQTVIKSMRQLQRLVSRAL